MMTVALNTSQIDSLESLEAYNQMLSSRVHCSHDATRLDYACFLAARIKNYQQNKRHTLAGKCLEKAARIIQEINSNVERLKSESKSCLDSLEEGPEESYEYARALFEGERYQSVISFYNQIRELKPFEYFTKLRHEISGTQQIVAMNKLQVRRHESELEKQTPDNKEPLDSFVQYELNSFKHYQSMFERMALDRLLSRVMKEIPENAGPLNPERLLIKTFQAAQDISPVYLSQLISYYESLLTLQEIYVSEK